MKTMLLLALVAGHVALAQKKPSPQVLRVQPNVLPARADSRLLAPPLAQMVLSGQVRRVDLLRSVPLPGAMVSVPLPTGPLHTRTDTNGKFSLTLSQANLAALPDSVAVVATAIGCNSQTIKLKKAVLATVFFRLRPTIYKMESAHIILPATGSRPSARRHSGTPVSQQAFWPPPQCSTLQRLSNRYFAQAHTLSDVDDILYNALSSATYDDLRYYAAPNGFVLITRVEQINDDGVALPGKERWSPDVPDSIGFSLVRYLKALFIPTVGHFRVIAFAVTDQPITTYRPAPQEDEARVWLQQGANELDPDVGALPYGRGYHCTALIYEFKQAAELTGSLDVSGALDATTHLTKSRIMAGLPKLTP
ncbi:carboxypeptidase-like regulatory domain-containing protein [Hymenobacter psoromatis]|uniref:carboxypeptidase-like regulatory domain-containing protein n=1 Tax=Hymenobacter psoromatis TaxID=1484116 RepID=UPI001CC0F2F9|nr:carboxypeptidase-like regulatory domain-containing protein [Hymenobacter psoromatis]